MAESSITIDAPAETVFAYVSDISRHSEWAEHKLEIESSGGAVAVGSVYETVGHQFGRSNSGKVTVTELEPNQRIVYESEGDRLHMRHVISCAAADGGTLVTKSVEPVKLGFPISLLFPIISVFGIPARGLAGDLDRIKAKLEGGSAPAADTPAEPPASEEPKEGE